MNATDELKTIALADQSGSAPAGAEYLLKAAVVYEAAPGRDWAGQVCQWIQLLVGERAVKAIDTQIS